MDFFTQNTYTKLTKRLKKIYSSKLPQKFSICTLLLLSNK